MLKASKKELTRPPARPPRAAVPRGARAVSLEDVRERSRDDAAAVQAGTAAAAAGGAAGGSGTGAGGCGGSADQGAVNDKGTDGKLLSDSPVNTPTAVPVSGTAASPAYFAHTAVMGFSGPP